VRRRRHDALAAVNLLEVVPVRVAEWEEQADGRVVIHRPLPKTSGLRNLIDRLLFEMSTRRIRLDAVGSHAWQQFDGTQSVAEIAGALRAEFGDDVEPAEERVCKLVQMLHGQLLVEYPGIDE
jgi:hypothetical protein